MKHHLKLILTLACPLLAGAIHLRAQGTAFTYQGYLNDGATPATGIYDLRFTIHDSTNVPGVVVAGPLTNAATRVSNGLFIVTLDFGAAPFTGADRWLEIAVRTNGAGAFTPLAPRQPLLPVPYAIFSAGASAAGLSGTIAAANIANGTLTGDMLAAGAVGSNQLAAGAVTTAALARGAVTAAKVFTTTALVACGVIPNPTPLALDQFGFAVASVGADHLLVGANLDNAGATNAGAAHLFDAAGRLRVTLTNPTPAMDDNFGFAVAAVGSDELLVGAPQDDSGALNAGSAYLFETSGTLLLTLTNPNPSTADLFGQAVAAIGSDRLVIAAPNDNAGTSQFGAVYLFDLAGNLTLTLTNPTPANLDGFGVAVVAVGGDKLLIGASSDDAGANNSGVAHLFSTNGALLTTLTNPTPAVGDNFGGVVAVVGADRLLITAPSDDTGAAGAGSAYLFDLAGTLLTTFTNPTPAAGDMFGDSVAALGSNRLLIGATGDGTGAAGAGAAYLFRTTGTLLATFTNPTPAVEDAFGWSILALGGDRVLISAPSHTGSDAGAVYLFKTNGTLIATFVNPTTNSADAFGYSVAAVGTDRVLIGAPKDPAGATEAGAAYLFSTNGTLLTILTNPTPAAFDHFGASVSAVGEEQLLIGAVDDDTGGDSAGAAYLFDTNGALLTTLTNPTPADADVFSVSVAAVGTDRLLITAPNDHTGAPYAGAAYLFSLAAYNEGLTADAVRARAIVTASLADEAVTLEKLDSSIGVWTRRGHNIYREFGNVGIGTNNPGEKLVVVGDIFATGTITPNSDRNLKTGFAPVDAADILNKVSHLPIRQWRFKSESEAVRHIGPMAQDFRAAFGLGKNPTAIATVDADGVALAAIQGLNEKVESRIRKLTDELKRRDVENAELQRRIERLERMMSKISPASP
jgi:hypothetical protein